MGHRRREIRALVCSLLKNKTCAGNNVFNWRLFPVQDECLYPNINVMTFEEHIHSFSSNHLLQERNVKVSIIISDLIDDLKRQNKCDEVSEEIENILISSYSEEFLLNLDKIEFFLEAETRKTIAICQMTFDCKYYSEVKLNQSLDDFKSISVGVSDVNF